jgi:hypothetical protein
MCHYDFKEIKWSGAGFRHRWLPLIALLAVIALHCAAIGTLYAQSAKYDNFGTEFYVAYGPNLGGEDPGFETQNTMDLYITSHVPANGTVEVPAIGFFQTFTTTPGQITTITLPNGDTGTQTVELQESMDEQVIQGMAVHITSDSEIAVFGINHKKYSSDSYMGLPINVLGTEYRTINYNSSSVGGFGGSLTPGEFWIVAVNDSTNVTITLKDVSSLGTAANQPIQVQLNKGDIYLIEGGEESTSNDLTGSLIESDQPIAVFSGHRRTEMPKGAVNTDGSPSRDHLVEQLPPVSAWGDSALVVPYVSSVEPDLVRAVFAEDSTQISVNGVPVAKTFNAGDFYEITKLAGVTSIQATKPIEVGQYMHTSYGSIDANPPAYGDPALALVFPVEQFQSSYTIISIVNPGAFTGNFVNIVADASSIGSMTIDGKPINPSEFKPIPNTRFDYAQHTLVQGTHNLSCASPFGVTVYALGPVDSYAHPGGTLLKTITPLQTIGLVIDFGDRVLTAANTKPMNNYDSANAAASGVFDTTVVLKNISEDTVNIYSFPERIGDIDRFRVDSTSDGLIPGTGIPLTIAPLARDSFRIQFWPREVNRRMHTQITANTDHLHAYVVDVYGRGVQDNMGIFADTNKTITIDTLDFGTFQKSDPVGDSEVYVGNAGSAVMNVNAVSITSPSVIFSETGISYQGATVTLPFAIAEPPSGSARINVQFSPTGLANGLYSDSLIITSATSTHIVVLIGHIETITALQPGVDSVTWGSTLVCDNAVFSIPISNDSNNVPITLTSARIIGVNASDFALSTRTPLVIPAGKTDTVQVNFIPSDSGSRAAQVIFNFNLPRLGDGSGPSDTVNLLGTGDKPTLEFAADPNVHAYVLDNYFLMPIYARTDLTPYAADGYHIYVQYDSVNLRLVDVITAGTLTPPGYLSIISSSPPGRDTINFGQGGEGSKNGINLIAGGGPTDDTPLLYLKFQPVMSGADDPADANPLTFEKGFPLNFSLIFDDAVIPYQCTNHVFDSGYAVVGPACDTQFLEQQPTIPDAMMLGTPIPNPANVPISIQYDVASVGNNLTTSVTIDLVDAQGNLVETLVNDQKQPGYYSATINSANVPSGLYFLRMSAGNYQRIRNLVIQK